MLENNNNKKRRQLEAGIGIEADHNTYKYPGGFSLAAKRGDAATVARLLGHGACPNGPVEDGAEDDDTSRVSKFGTPLQVALENIGKDPLVVDGHREIIKMLLAHDNIDTGIRHSDGRTALHIALDHPSDIETFRLLVEKANVEAKQNWKDDDGDMCEFQTPLGKALSKDLTEHVAVLLEAKADPNAICHFIFASDESEDESANESQPRFMSKIYPLQAVGDNLAMRDLLLHYGANEAFIAEGEDAPYALPGSRDGSTSDAKDSDSDVGSDDESNNRRVEAPFPARAAGSFFGDQRSSSSSSSSSSQVVSESPGKTR